MGATEKKCENFHNGELDDKFYNYGSFSEKRKGNLTILVFHIRAFRFSDGIKTLWNTLKQ